METIDFGRTGLHVSRLSFGTGTHGWAGHSQQTGLGLKRLSDLLCLAYRQGVTFWDAADAYGSHPHVARALQRVPRDEITIATKTTSHTAAQVTQDIERFRRELNIDVIDVVLLHFMTQSNWTHSHAGAMAALARAKAQGRVRAIGVSCHGLGSLRAAAASDWPDVVLARINYAGVNMSASPAEVVPILEQMHAAGKAIWGMKVLGCGQLASQARQAIHYVLGLGCVHAIVIGTSSQAQLTENVQWVEEGTTNSDQI